MLALLWTGFNLLFLGLIIYVWMRVFWVLRREIGAALALLFLLSLAAFKSGSGSTPERPKNLLASDSTTRSLGNWQSHRSISLNPNNKLYVLVEAKRTEESVQPTGLYTTTSGFMLGHEWKPLMGIVNPGRKSLAYHLIMLHEWKLLGMNLYTISEEYTGSISADAQQ